MASNDLVSCSFNGVKANALMEKQKCIDGGGTPCPAPPGVPPTKGRRYVFRTPDGKILVGTILGVAVRKQNPKTVAANGKIAAKHKSKVK